MLISKVNLISPLIFIWEMPSKKVTQKTGIELNPRLQLFCYLVIISYNKGNSNTRNFLWENKRYQRVV